MPIIELDYIQKKKPLSKEEEVKKKIELAKKQVAEDQKAFNEAYKVFFNEIKKLPTYAPYLNAIDHACYKRTNQLIELLLKYDSRSLSSEMKQVRAQLFAEIITAMEKK